MWRHLSCKSSMLMAGAVAADGGRASSSAPTRDQDAQGRTVEFRIQDGRAKITSQPGQAIYYDHAKRTAYIVDTEKKTSFEMDEERAKQVGAQLGGSPAHDGSEDEGAPAREARHGRGR